MAIQLLIVNFLYSPPGLLRIENPQANLPAWLLADYQNLYERTPSSSAQETTPKASVPPPIFTSPSNKYHSA